MKIEAWLSESSKKLEKSGISTARLDCLVLLEDAIGQDRANLLAHPELGLKDKLVEKLSQQIDRRALHEPLAYIRGKTEFYGRKFCVSPDTLEPRAESETMIDLLKKAVSPTEKLTLADIGTGSGALAITSKLELSNLIVMGTEVSKPALKIANQNAKKHNVDVKFFEGNLLEPLKKLPNIIVANLPYVPNAHTINQAAMHEPEIAIFGGPDGLDLYRKMFKQINGLLKKPVYVLAESLPPQHKELVKIAGRSGYSEQTEDDFIQVFVSSNL